MNVITLLNEKGGVGKTTLATHIAAGLAIRGQRVLLIDADPQGHSTVAFGIAKRPCFHDFIARDEPFKQVVVRVPHDRYAAKDTPPKGDLLLMPGNIETRVVPLIISDHEYLKDRLQEIKKFVDTVVFDTSPTPSLLHGSIYIATDSILYPVIPAARAIEALFDSLNHRESARSVRQRMGIGDIKVAGIIPMMYQQITNAHDFGLSLLTSNFKQQVWGPLPRRTVWEQAAYAQKMLYAFDPQADATQHAWQVVDRTEKVMAA